jgi:carbamoyltransferase
MADFPVVIGLNRTQDASVCLARGLSLLSIQKERFTRQKHHWGRIGDIGLYAERIPELKGSVDAVVECYASDPEVRKLDDYQQELTDTLGLGPDVPRIQISHHLSHLYATFPFSPYERAAVMIIDCAGSYLADITEDYPARPGHDATHMEISSFYVCGPEGYECVEKYAWDMDWSRPKGLGAFYFLLSRTLFGGEGNEGKVMGLAPYGDPDALGLPPLKVTDGEVEIPQAWTDTFEQGLRFGHFVKDGAGSFEDSAHLAAAGQQVFEEALLEVARWLHRTTGVENLCFAGGTALNCVANSRLLNETPYENVFISPFPHDGGTALGCALYGIEQLSALESMPLVDDYMGPEPDDALVRAAFEQAAAAEDVVLERPDDLTGRLVDLFCDGAVVGLYRGRSELGPRALGNRSLLADPRDEKVRDWINSQIKGREWFRPLAPVTTVERAAEYFGLKVPVPFMQFTADVLEERRAAVPAVVHVDGTARLQTVAKEENSFLHGLITSFAERTGVPVLLNTSLNGPGEPIVETVHEALHFFLSSPMDALAAPPYLLRKQKLARPR